MSFENALNFDPATVEDAAWDPIPDGEYTAQVISAEMQQPRSGDGHHVAVVWKIIDGPHTNREIRDWVAVSSSNSQRQKIGQQMLKAMSGAMGLTFVRNASDFCFKPAIIVVGTKKDDRNGEDRNRIKRIKPLTGTAVPSNVPSVSAIAAATASTKPAGSAPWSR